MRLSNALLISFIGHCLVVSSLGIGRPFAHHEKTRMRAAKYYSITPIRLIKIAPEPERTTAAKKRPAGTKLRYAVRKHRTARARRTAPPNPPAPVEPKPQEAAPQPPPKPIEQEITASITPPRPPPKPEVIRANERILSKALSGATLEAAAGTTLPNTPECMSYYQYIRENIRLKLEKGYRHEYNEGVVIISFGITRTGELSNIRVLEERSSNDPTLQRIAYDSVKDASPFRPFPNDLALPQISFNLTVVFKRS